MFNENFKIRHLIGGALLMSIFMYGFIWFFTVLGMILT